MQFQFIVRQTQRISLLKEKFAINIQGEKNLHADVMEKLATPKTSTTTSNACHLTLC